MQSAMEEPIPVRSPAFIPCSHVLCTVIAPTAPTGTPKISPIRIPLKNIFTSCHSLHITVNAPKLFPDSFFQRIIPTGITSASASTNAHQINDNSPNQETAVIKSTGMTTCLLKVSSILWTPIPNP